MLFSGRSKSIGAFVGRGLEIDTLLQIILFTLMVIACVQRIKR